MHTYLMTALIWIGSVACAATNRPPTFVQIAENAPAITSSPATSPSEWISMYQESLADRPRRAASLLGLARAQMSAGDHTGTEKTYNELSAIWRNADPAVRAFLRHQ